MKRFVVLASMFSVLFFSGYVFAGKGGEKCASKQAYENANEKAIFHRAGDWFSTIGKSEEEKQEIIQKRDQKRMEKKAQKADRKAKKEAGKAQKKLKK